MAFQWSSKNQAQNGVEDMVLLSKVTDDQITDNLKKRFMTDLMYTYIGSSLVVFNPYKKLGYFTEKEIDIYHGSAAYENPPHIYALADKMFQSMVTDEENQCVIISGESGAGKTESAKLIMNYIAAVSGKGGSMNTLVENIKQIILESNPLLESFGNAKTLRNNNSSRFGKYFEINFSRGGAPVGGKISNFLLEKSRVVGPGVGERNFHIFYQITMATTGQLKENLGMTDPNYFHYLNASREYKADGIDDKQEFEDMKRAMEVCNISKQDQSSIFEILAGILHLGNVDFTEEGNNAAIADAQTLEFPAYLLGVDSKLLEGKLLSRLMTTGGFGRRSSEYNVPLNAQQAQGTRDALAKALYSRLFDWIIAAVNSALATVSAGASKQSLCLGVLDIFGFEIFEKNGFEQFCINYVNERLQQIFIELTLKSEQEEYMREGIQWTPIEYFNNKVVVDLIESKRPPGVMAILDDVCFTMHAVAEGADQTFVQKLDGAVSQNRHYQGMQQHFVIKHYAGDVTYDCAGFTEANKDTLFKDLVQLMKSTNKPFIRNLFPEEYEDNDRKRPTTVSFKIRNQCQELVETLMKCTPSYVRCIKPNETKRSHDWDARRVEHQVRYLNLKENIKVRRAGFCYRNTFQKFLKRFAILTPETFPAWSGNPHDGIKLIMNSVNMDAKEWQLGAAKVFIKSPESLFLLEEQRDRKYHSYAIVIQRAYRRWKSRKYFLEMRKKAAEVVYGKKERKRFSVNREFLGDYLGYLSNSILKALVGKNEKVFFADFVQKYDRKFKPTQREFIITENSIFIIGVEKQASGPNKGKMLKVVKRKIEFNEIGSVSLSTKNDDFFVVHIPKEYDNVLENLFKTELITVLSEKYELHLKRPLKIDFVDSIKYSVKKTTWQAGGFQELKFIADSTAKQPLIKHSGKTTEIRVAPGMPKDSRPNASTLMQRETRRPQAQSSAPANRFANAAQAASKFTPPAAAAATSSLAQSGRAASNNAVRAGGSPPSSNSGSAANLANAAAAKRKPPPVPPAKKLPTCRALYDYDATEADELSFKAGDTITIINSDDPGWWTGNLNGKRGLFPMNYVEKLA
ncbi:P-loop containing nucleoside triphosphate hydrolase protein [Polychytrium aggregatum]|uniref:P-loop containing nucleoside triphosphate hydrolase protein n=1 Tax=Polychytrium aggregatum TaxID=110093 RepID=UPI0022FEB1C7|nr:P-loop containing nucleoside triphosphate hydrolase protein [Polychytrium aggregatum]KAI9202468.1 P-loop containing nucleoside triphosphate hydrolase protein [Polychytrium aggregatum]